MNLSKTEKLLAARKRLKEFQLHKKQQPQGNQESQQNIEGATTCHSDKAEPAELIRHQTINDDHSDKSENNHVPGAIFEEPSNSREEIHSNVIDNVDNSINYNPNQNERPLAFLNPETSTMQKENLLQMVSAVSNVLTDTEECNVSNTLDSDLEYRNQFLASCLEEQKQLVNQLHVRVSEYHSRVSELEAILVTKEAEFEARLVREISPLKEQLQIHAQTTGILIAEKAELTASLNQCQITVKQKSEELEELLGKFKTCQLRMNELEKELSSIKNNTEDTRKTFHQIQSEYMNLEGKYNELRKVKEDLDLETSELKQKLNLKNTELINLQQELEEKSALLSLNELKLKQITNSSQELPTLEGQHHTVAMLEQQLNQTRDTLKAMNDEKEEASKQYQNYVRQLDIQISKLQQELEKRDKMIHEFESREQSYVQRLSDLEQKLQSERDKVENLIPLQNHQEEIDSLNRTIHELNLEQERLHIMLSEKETDLESAKKELSELQEFNEQNVEAAKLAKALEGEQIGASRAVSQNQQLKQQLNEMHDAFVLLSNTKLDLTEQLQAERHIGRKLNIHLNKIEAEMDRLKEQLKEKEAALMELEKEKLQNAQITDQMQHYQAQSHNAHTLQEELQRALITIENLKKENKELSEVEMTMKNHQESINEVDTSEQAIKENGQCLNDIAIQTETGTVVASAADSNTLEPMKKLEERFKDTMERVAELTDEKQRLEHLVLQLQSETETIGEYITLYQKQRSILQEKAKEKEQTFQQLLEQRNHQQEQLHKLKVLVADLIKKKSHILNEISLDADHKDVNHKDQSPQERQTNEESIVSSPTIEVKNPTTSQILDLLAEIKDCKDTSIVEPNFHPCPWCSGKLITV